VRFQWSFSTEHVIGNFQGVYTPQAIEIAQLKGTSEKKKKTESGTSQERRFLLDWYMK
jgi:hypothetical protein